MLLTAGMVAALLVLLFMWQDYQKFTRTTITVPEQGMPYILEKGSGLASFSTDLYKKGVISSLTYFRWLAQISGDADKLRAGEYFFTPEMTPVQLMEMVTKGQVAQHSFTIIEGWDFKTLVRALRKRRDIEHTLMLDDTKKIVADLQINSPHPEGWLMPETYFFTLGMTDVQILRRAVRAMQEYLQKAWENRAEGLLLKTPYEALIFASLIEKETAKASERQQISGVFHRRLKKHMRLETDPTVIYGMGERYDGNIRKKDLRTDTPYNTYTRHGLPPTPIAMPGKAAIQAALHPETDSQALYFVARGDGSHVFSSTFKDHVAAVRYYQLKRRHVK